MYFFKNIKSFKNILLKLLFSILLLYKISSFYSHACEQNNLEYRYFDDSSVPEILSEITIKK